MRGRLPQSYHLLLPHQKRPLERSQVRHEFLRIKLARRQGQQVEVHAQEFVFLGHVLSKDGIKPDPEKIKVISKMPLPQGRGQLRASLCMIAYAQQFIPNCEELTAPLSAITSEKRPIVWTPKQDRCFQELKRQLCSAPILQCRGAIAHINSRLTPPNLTLVGPPSPH